MAKIIGAVPEKELKARIKQARKIRYSKPLRVDFGAILKEALKTSKSGS